MKKILPAQNHAQAYAGINSINANDLPLECNYGMTTPLERNLLYSIIKNLPNNSVVVEVGAALGGTSCLLASVNPSITVHCVDPFKDYYDMKYEGWYWRNPFFEGDKELVDIVENCFLNDASGKLTFEAITKKFHNIKLHHKKSPEDILNWNQTIDVCFEDSVHTNPELQSNINFWIEHIKPGGYMIGHDYDSASPNVITEFNKLINLGWTLIAKMDSLIVLEKPYN